MSERTWRIDPGLAADLAAGLGWDPGDGVAALTARLPEQVPAGSTAKLSAIAAGDVPPGADVDQLARALVDHQHALAAPPAGGAPSPSWSCWVFTSAMAALVDWADLILTMTGSQKAYIERAFGSGEKVFTIGEYAYPDGSDGDIDDPWGQSVDVYRRVAEQIEGALRAALNRMEAERG